MEFVLLEFIGCVIAAWIRLPSWKEVPNKVQSVWFFLRFSRHIETLFFNFAWLWFFIFFGDYHSLSASCWKLPATLNNFLIVSGRWPYTRWGLKKKPNIGKQQNIQMTIFAKSVVRIKPSANKRSERVATIANRHNRGHVSVAPVSERAWANVMYFRSLRTSTNGIEDKILFLLEHIHHCLVHFVSRHTVTIRQK